jgi:NitT/TauT family transport system permease protein
MNAPTPRYSRWTFPLGAGIVLVAAWYGVKHAFHLPSYVLPAPDEILAAAWQERRTLLASALITGRGALLGFLAAVGIGFFLSLVMAFSMRLKESLYPYVLMLQMTPVIILAPIFVLWLGQGLPAIVAVTFMICFFPVVANTAMGFASVDRNLRELFVMCRASRWQEVVHLRIPSAMPYFLTGMKIAATLAPIGAITGDFLAGSQQNGVAGIGFMTIVYFSQLKIPALFATGMAACLLGFFFVGGVSLLHWLILRRWHDSMTGKES